MRRFIFIILLIVSGFNRLFGQVHDPVKWQAVAENVTATTADLVFTAQIEEGWSIYALKVVEGPIPTSFSLEGSEFYSTDKAVEEMTKPEVKHDESFGVNVGKHKHKAVFKQAIRVLTTKAFTVKGKVEYMCCNDRTCLPPKDVDLLIAVTPAVQNAGSGLKQVATVDGGLSSHAQGTTDAPDETSIAVSGDSAVETSDSITPSETNGIVSTDVAPTSETSDDGSLWAFFLTALSMGFLGVLTPCVYPMIPLTVSFFLKGEQKRKGVIKAIVFGLSIILIYTAIGLLVTLTKRADLTNEIVGHWLTNLIFAILFIVFAMSFFGLFEITLPSSLSNRSDQQASKGGYLSAFFIALTLVIVSFSCTGPFVGGILVASAQGLAVKPILGMFGFGLAFALPFTLLAFFPALMKRLPKSGGWMNSVKVVFAFIMLAFAVYFLSYTDKAMGWHIITRNVFICLWIVLFGMTGLYLLGKIRLSHDSEVKSIGVVRLMLAIASFTFTMYLFTGLLGEPLRAISGLLPAAESSNIRQGAALSTAGGLQSGHNRLCGVPKYSEHTNLSWPLGLQGYFDYDEALACAREKQKPVLLIFKGEHCAKCREMEANIWPDPEVLRLLDERFVLLALYTDTKIPLPESEFFTSTFDGKLKKTLGQKNADIEITRYRTNEFPFYAILDDTGKTIATQSYTDNIQIFKEFLQK